jgi:hypothetical protein
VSDVVCQALYAGAGRIDPLSVRPFRRAALSARLVQALPDKHAVAHESAG